MQTTNRHPSLYLFHIGGGKRLNNTGALAESCTEDAVGILEHAVLQGHHNELRTLEACLDKATDVLGMRQIQRGIDLIENVHWRRFELQERHDQGQSDQGSVQQRSAARTQENWAGECIPLSSTQLRQTLLPDLTQRHLDF